MSVPVAVAAACGGSTDGSAAERAWADRRSRSSWLLNLDSLTIEDSDGERWHFETRGARFFNFSPSHLTEHMVQGLPVTVTFQRDGDGLVVSGIGDYPCVNTIDVGA